MRSLIDQGRSAMFHIECSMSSYAHPGWWRSDKAISGGMYDWARTSSTGF
jgi:hypothetical protein